MTPHEILPPFGLGMCAPKKAKRKAQPEKAIQKAIMDAFQFTHRIKLYRTDAGGMGDKKGVQLCQKALRSALGIPDLPWGLEPWIGLPAGFPDLLTPLPGNRFLFIEVKAPGGSFRKGQKEFLAAELALLGPGSHGNCRNQNGERNGECGEVAP